MLVDTHCHIHEADFPLDPDVTIERAHAAGVSEMIVVGTSEESSRTAVDFAALHDGIYAAIGVHPHETHFGWNEIQDLVEAQKIVAVGEIGLDYFYNHSPREVQIKALEEQLQLAMNYNLPVIFHVRDKKAERGESVWQDFWPIFDNFPGLRGELHSFTDTVTTLEEGLRRNLYIGVNGISTFAKKDDEQAMFTAIPLDKMLLETDAPFLTPVPFRGKVNEPAFVREVAAFQAAKRQLSLDEVANQTTLNAHALFAI